MSNHPKANFDRTCAECKFFAPGIFPRCNVSRNLITGAVLPTDVHAARSPKGHCGPAGKRWEAVATAAPIPTTVHTNINSSAVSRAHKARQRRNGVATGL